MQGPVARDVPTGDRAERLERRSVSDRRARPETTGCFPSCCNSLEARMNDPTVSPLPTATVFAGIDWASTDHAVCVVDAAGAVLWRHTVTHSRAGLTRLTSRLRELNVARVGIE